jgi:hypothetical protein
MKKRPKKPQCFRMSHDLLHRIKVLEREKKDKFKNQTDVIIKSIEQGLERYEGLERHNLLQNLEQYRQRRLGQIRIVSSISGNRSDTPDDLDDLELHRLSVRMSIELLTQIEELAKKRGAEIHHTSKKTNLSPTIVYLIKLGLEQMEPHTSATIGDSLMLYPPSPSTASCAKPDLMSPFKTYDKFV